MTKSSFDWLVSIIPLACMFVGFYWFLIRRPLEKQKMRAGERLAQAQALIGQLREKVLVVTVGHIVGREIRQVLGAVTGRSPLEASTHLEQEIAEQEALAALMVNTLNMGANAVVDLRLSNSSHEQTYTKWMGTTTCYSGTAVDIN
jgi:uncharacterized protein YbjQ (UPF0145 family)